MPIYIQIEDAAGQWRTVATVDGQPRDIIERMDEQKQRLPAARLRAVDARGEIIDSLD